MINLNDVVCVKIGTLLFSVHDITSLTWHGGTVEIEINSELMQGNIASNKNHVSLVTVE